MMPRVKVSGHVFFVLVEIGQGFAYKRNSIGHIVPGLVLSPPKQGAQSLAERKPDEENGIYSKLLIMTVRSKAPNFHGILDIQCCLRLLSEINQRGTGFHLFTLV